MRPLAQRAEERLARVREGSEPHWALLEQIAQQDRGALLRGQKPSAKNQADGLLLRRTVEQQRAQAEEELVRSLVLAMQSILTRGQLHQVHGLFIGDPRWDGRSTPSPALADVTSGFVSAERAEVRRLRVGRVADLRHSSQVHAAAAAVATAQGQQMEAHENEEASKSRAEEAAAIELQQYQERQSPSAEAISEALRHFVRRLFLSPRLRPVLEERLPSSEYSR